MTLRFDIEEEEIQICYFFAYDLFILTFLTSSSQSINANLFNSDCFSAASAARAVWTLIREGGNGNNHVWLDWWNYSKMFSTSFE